MLLDDIFHGESLPEFACMLPARWTSKQPVVTSGFLSTHAFMVVKICVGLVMMLMINHIIACCWYGNWAGFICASAGRKLATSEGGSTTAMPRYWHRGHQRQKLDCPSSDGECRFRRGVTLQGKLYCKLLDGYAGVMRPTLRRCIGLLDCKLASWAKAMCSPWSQN